MEGISWRGVTFPDILPLSRFIMEGFLIKVSILSVALTLSNKLGYWFKWKFLFCDENLNLFFFLVLTLKFRLSLFLGTENTFILEYVFLCLKLPFSVLFLEIDILRFLFDFFVFFVPNEFFLESRVPELRLILELSS